jgi:hypothetical protein
MKTARRNVLIEGYSADEILTLPNEQLDRFVFCGEPIVFRAGSAEILCGTFSSVGALKSERSRMSVSVITSSRRARLRPTSESSFRWSPDRVL